MVSMMVAMVSMMMAMVVAWVHVPSAKGTDAILPFPLPLRNLSLSLRLTFKSFPLSLRLTLKPFSLPLRHLPLSLRLTFKPLPLPLRLAHRPFALAIAHRWPLRIRITRGVSITTLVGVSVALVRVSVTTLVGVSVALVRVRIVVSWTSRIGGTRVVLVHILALLPRVGGVRGARVRSWRRNLCLLLQNPPVVAMDELDALLPRVPVRVGVQPFEINQSSCVVLVEAVHRLEVIPQAQEFAVADVVPEPHRSRSFRSAAPSVSPFFSSAPS